MKYKVGDILKIRTDLEAWKSYDGYSISEETIRKYAGKEITVGAIHHGATWKVKTDEVDTHCDGYTAKETGEVIVWTDGMVECMTGSAGVASIRMAIPESYRVHKVMYDIRDLELCTVVFVNNDDNEMQCTVRVPKGCVVDGSDYGKHEVSVLYKRISGDDWKPYMTHVKPHSWEEMADIIGLMPESAIPEETLNLFWQLVILARQWRNSECEDPDATEAEYLERKLMYRIEIRPNEHVVYTPTTYRSLLCFDNVKDAQDFAYDFLDSHILPLYHLGLI